MGSEKDSGKHRGNSDEGSGAPQHKVPFAGSQLRYEAFQIKQQKTECRLGCVARWKRRIKGKGMMDKPVRKLSARVCQCSESGPVECKLDDGLTHYNYIGTTWASACNALLNTVLRDEWGYQGFCLTEYFIGNGFMNSGSDDP